MTDSRVALAAASAIGEKHPIIDPEWVYDIGTGSNRQLTLREMKRTASYPRVVCKRNRTKE